MTGDCSLGWRPDIGAHDVSGLKGQPERQSSVGTPDFQSRATFDLPVRMRLPEIQCGGPVAHIPTNEVGGPHRLARRSEGVHAVRISRAHERFSLYHSTSREIPSSRATVGFQSSSRRARVMLAQVAGTSAGWAGLNSMRASLPTSFSTMRIVSIKMTG